MRQHHHLCLALEATMDLAPDISGAAYFGSSASRRLDRYSDVDLVVRCDPAAAKRLLEHLHASIGLVLFRPFTEDRSPSGRYWFADTNPFARLDVSFHEPADFDDLLVHGRGFAQPPFRSIELNRGQGPRATLALPTWTHLDHEFGGALRAFHESAKHLARGLSPKRSLVEAETALMRYRARAVRPEAWDLYEASLWAPRSSP